MFWRKALKEEIDHLQEEVNELGVTKSNLQQNAIDNQELRRINAESTSEISKLKKQIRGQLEADLFFASAKICSDLASGKTKEEMASQIDYQRRLREQLRGMAQAPSVGLGSPFAQFAGQAPFPSIFGGLFR